MIVHYVHPTRWHIAESPACDKSMAHQKQNTLYTDRVTCEECRATKEYQMGLLWDQEY